MRARISTSIAAAVLSLPLLASAQTTGGLFNLLSVAARVLNALVGIFVLAAIVVFFWGLVQYLLDVGEQKAKGLQTMIWGIIAIFVMVSIWGIVRILQQTVGVDSSAANQAIIPAGIIPANTH